MNAKGMLHISKEHLCLSWTSLTDQSPSKPQWLWKQSVPVSILLLPRPLQSQIKKIGMSMPQKNMQYKMNVKCWLWFCTLGLSLNYLVYIEGTTQASSPCLFWELKGTVVSDDHHVDSHTVIAGLLCGQSKVETVASVVFHNQKDSGSSC